MGKQWKVLVCLVGVALFVLPLVGCAPTTPPKALEPYTIGYTDSASGYMAAMGIEHRDVLVMMEEKVNKEGGINGRPVKIIYYDDESDESKGVLTMKKLINEDKVLALIATSSSGIAMAQAPIVEEAKVPWISMNAMYAVLVPPKKWIFKTSPSEKIYYAIFYKFFKDRGITKVALFNQGAAQGREARKYLEATAAQQGITLVAEEEYGPTDTDMRPQWAKIKAANPQAVILYGSEPAGAMAVGQAKEMGITVPIIGIPGLTMAAIVNVKELAAALEGFIPATPKVDVWQQLPDTDPQKKFMQELDNLVRAKYGDKYKRIDWTMAGAYDSFIIMMNAIKKTNLDPTNREAAQAKLRDALEQQGRYVGAYGILEWTPEEHEGYSVDCYTISQIKGGQFELIK